MRDPLRPGYNHVGELYAANAANVRRMAGKLLQFVTAEHWVGRVADVGPSNPKMDWMSRRMGVPVTQIVADDFNWDSLHGQYDTVFCLEVLEHVQNPLWFMRQLRGLLAPGGVLYLTTPSNPHWLWYPFHFHEMDRARIERWLLTPLGMRVVRHKRFNFVNDWRAALIGVRPLLRAIRHWDVRPIVWSLVQINNFYEVRCE